MKKKAFALIEWHPVLLLRFDLGGEEVIESLSVPHRAWPRAGSAKRNSISSNAIGRTYT